MCCAKYIAALALSVSIALAGFPVQAMQPCPMMRMLPEKAAGDMQSAHDCDGCPRIEAVQNQKRAGCCDDPACRLQCFPASGMNLSSAPLDALPQWIRQTQGISLPDPALSSHRPHSQDRPPKHLS